MRQKLRRRSRRRTGEAGGSGRGGPESRPGERKRLFFLVVDCVGHAVGRVVRFHVDHFLFVGAEEFSEEVIALDRPA